MFTEAAYEAVEDQRGGVMPALSHHDIQVTVTVTIKPRHEGVDVPVMISMGRIGRDNGTARGTVLKTR